MPEFQIIPPPYDPDEDEIKVAPVEAESAAEVSARLQRLYVSHVENPLDDDDELEREPLPPAHTFTLKELIYVVTALSVWLAVLRLLQWLSWPVAAFATGVVTVAGAVYLWNINQQTGMTRLIWWVLFATYLTTTLLALLSV